MRSKAFFINGGAGRVICSIPALEKYAEESGDNEFVIICEGGMDMYKGHPELHARCYDNWHKDLFEEKLKDKDIVSPEPYRIWEYYNQKCNLNQAFDIAINNKGIRDLQPPKLYLNIEEELAGKNLIAEVKEVTKKDKLIVIQPFGRGIQQVGNFIADPSSRSIEFVNLVQFIKKLSANYGIILMSEMQFNFEAEGIDFPVAQPKDINLRQWAGIIKEANYFFGCDSVGQHIAYSFDKPATVIIGSTFAENISYPDNEKFDIQDMGEGKRTYDPIRIMPDDHANRTNDKIMLMNEPIIDVIVKSINTNFDKWVKIEKPKLKNADINVLDNPTASTSKLKLMPGLGNVN